MKRIEKEVTEQLNEKYKDMILSFQVIIKFS